MINNQAYNHFVSHRVRLNARILPFIVLLLFIMQLIDPSRIWTSLLVGLGGAWLIAYFWARTLAGGLHIKREMRYGWAQVGDKLEERFTLTNSSTLPATWVEISDLSTIPGYSASIATGVEGNSSNQWVTDGTCTRRGLYWLGNTTVHSGDPLGIYSITIEDPARINLMVVPPVIPLPQIQITPGGYLGEGRPRPNAPEYTVGAAGVREYLPGDSLHTIHWKTTARREKPYVRLFDGAPAGDWWILLDLQKDVQIGLNEDSTEEHAIILAASLADKGIHAHQAVGLVTSGNNLVWLPPQPGENQRWRILRELALVNPGDVPLSELLERIRPNLSRRSSLLLITPSIDPSWLSSLAMLAWRGIVPTILLLDRVSYGGVGSIKGMASALGEMGIARHIITRDMLDGPEARPGHHGQWKWRVTATGRAIPVHLPGDNAWRGLSR